MQQVGAFPQVRPRRLRASQAIRDLVQEHQLSVQDFIYPLFVVPGEKIREPLDQFPGVYHYSIDCLLADMPRFIDAGIRSVLLFGAATTKDPFGVESYDAAGVLPQAIAQVKAAFPDMLVMSDVCVCCYTDHGHCGPIEGEPGREVIANDATLDALGKIACAHAEAGADFVAPSGMMDGMVSAMRQAMDAAGFPDVGILSYAVKYASAFYGPFRYAVDSSPRFGDRRTHQMNPANEREALREMAQDVAEGADMLMVKPAMPYLDIIHQAKQHHHLPVVAYQVSGEYAMIKQAAAVGLLDETAAMLESLLSIKRAGADLIISYYALEFAEMTSKSVA